MEKYKKDWRFDLKGQAFLVGAQGHDVVGNEIKIWLNRPLLGDVISLPARITQNGATV